METTRAKRRETPQRQARRKSKGEADRLTSSLGATRSFKVSTKPHGPFGVAALLDEIGSRLVSRGGRPSDPGTIRRLVPLKENVWRSLKSQAVSLSRPGRTVSPAQLAAILLEKSVSGLQSAPSGRRSRVRR